MKRNFLLISIFCFLGVVNVLVAQEVKINTDLVVEADGTLRMDGDATTWEDLRVPFTQAKQGSNFKPDFDPNSVGLLFPPASNDEIIYMVVQLPHAYKVGSPIYPHIHWQQTDPLVPTWSMDYKWFNNNEAVPGTFTNKTATTIEFLYSSGKAQISSFGAITGASGAGSGGLSNSEKGISSILLIKLWRVSGTGGVANILAFQFDIHYESDTQGSREEYYKENQ